MHQPYEGPTTMPPFWRPHHALLSLLQFLPLLSESFTLIVKKLLRFLFAIFHFTIYFENLVFTIKCCSLIFT